MSDYQNLLQKFVSVQDLLQSALDEGHGEFTLEDIWAGLAEDRLQLWVGPGFAAITEVVNYPHRRMVLVHLAAGDKDAIISAEGQLVQFAQIVKADHIKIIGRRGWVRALKDRGYEEAFTQVIKEVPNGRRQ